MATLKEIEEQARSLPPDERARLIEALLESLREGPLADIEMAWAREIEERLRAYERGETQAYAAQDVFADARHLSR